MFQWIQSRKWAPEISFTLASFFIFGTMDYFAQGSNALAVSGVLSLTLLFWRKVPLVSSIPLLAGVFGSTWFGLAPMFGYFAPLLSLALMAVKPSAKWVKFSSTAITVIALEFTAINQVALNHILLNDSAASPMASWVTYGIFSASVLAMAFGFVSGGNWLFLRTAHVGSGSDLLQLQNSTDANKLLASELESRLAIAQDISELVIQNISAVISRAEGGIYSAKSSPDSAMRSLERVLENAQNANNDVRRLTDLLRQDRGAIAAPPGISDLELLVKRYREQGFSAKFANEGKSFELNQGAQLAVYRIAFEALKAFSENAEKETTLSVDLIWSENGLQVLIKENSTSISNRKNPKNADQDAQYSVADDLQALVKPIDNQTIAVCRARANIYGGSADLTEVPGVGLTLSAYFPDIRLISSESGQ